MITIKDILDEDDKESITLKIMNLLPKWFSPPEDIIKKSLIHRQCHFFAAFDGNDAVGFIALKAHNNSTSEILNLGVLEQYQNQKIGTMLVNSCEQYLKDHNFQFLTVKTLDESANYEPYEKTRSFYYKKGFIPLEVFKTIWDADNPCLFFAKYIRR